MLKFLIHIFLVFFFISCNNQTTKSEDFGAFEISLPKGWKKVKKKGIDSYVGEITNGKDILTFDYGWYSYSLSDEDFEKQLFATDTINGKIAFLTKPKNTGNGTIGLYIKNAYNENNFNLIGSNIRNEEVILKIFKTVKFNDSDTTINSKNFNFISYK